MHTRRGKSNWGHWAGAGLGFFKTFRHAVSCLWHIRPWKGKSNWEHFALTIWVKSLHSAKRRCMVPPLKWVCNGIFSSYISRAPCLKWKGANVRMDEPKCPCAGLETPKGMDLRWGSERVFLFPLFYLKIQSRKIYKRRAVCRWYLNSISVGP